MVFRTESVSFSVKLQLHLNKRNINSDLPSTSQTLKMNLLLQDSPRQKVNMFSSSELLPLLTDVFSVTQHKDAHLLWQVSPGVSFKC